MEGEESEQNGKEINFKIPNLVPEGLRRGTGQLFAVLWWVIVDVGSGSLFTFQQLYGSIFPSESVKNCQRHKVMCLERNWNRR